MLSLAAAQNPMKMRKGTEETTDEAVGDAMGDAIAFSMPMRGVLSFGLCTKEELQNMIDEMNQL